LVRQRLDLVELAALGLLTRADGEVLVGVPETEK
jgi:hypothetical protein